MLPLSLSWIPILKKSSGKLQLKSHRMLLLLDSSTQTEHSERLIHITLMLRNCKVATSGLIDFYVWSGRQCLCPKLFSNLSIWQIKRFLKGWDQKEDGPFLAIQRVGEGGSSQGEYSGINSDKEL